MERRGQGRWRGEVWLSEGKGEGDQKSSCVRVRAREGRRAALRVMTREIRGAAA